MISFASAVYLLCFLTSVTAMSLLFRSYRNSRSRLLLWSTFGFVALAVNNLFLLLDTVVLPDVDLLPIRQFSALTGVGLLLYGLIQEVD